MANPNLLINGNSTTNGVNVSASSTVTVALLDPAGCASWTLQCIGTDELNSADAINATISINQAAKTATFTAPLAGSALIFASTVNGGVSSQTGLADASLTTLAGVYVLTSDGYRVGAQNETTEGDSNFGWVSKVNRMIRAGVGGGGSSFTAGGDLTGSSSSQQVVSLTGTAGVVTGPATAIAIGSSPATTGMIRLPNNKSVYARNFSNSADLLALVYDTDNYLQIGNSTATSRLQLSGAVSDAILTVGNTTSFRFNTTTLLTETPTWSWYATVAAPKWTQADKTSNGGTGEALTIQAQNETGTTSTGGALVLQSGTGTTTAGNIVLKSGSTTIGTLHSNGISFVTTSGNVGFQASAASIITSGTYTMLNSAITYLADGTGAGQVRCDVSSTANSIKGVSTITSLAIGFDDKTTNSGTGATLTIQAQNETGTTSIGGKLTLQSGTGTSQYGHVETVGSFLTGHLSYTFASDADQTLTAAQSANNIITVNNGVTTATRTLTLARPAVAGSWLMVFNNNAFAVNIKWGSGGSANIGASTGGMVFFDGTNAQTF